MSVRSLSAGVPLIIDESDATLDAFPRARALGYAGVSSKNCKGVYKSLLNAARCARWNAAQDGSNAFMTGEDLTAQPGLALQQDLAVAALSTLFLVAVVTEDRGATRHPVPYLEDKVEYLLRRDQDSQRRLNEHDERPDRIAQMRRAQRRRAIEQRRDRFPGESLVVESV